MVLHGDSLPYKLIFTKHIPWGPSGKGLSDQEMPQNGSKWSFPRGLSKGSTRPVPAVQNFPDSPLEIRSVCRRDRGVRTGVIFKGVLGAAHFPQFAFGALIGHQSRPWHGEHVLILDRQFDLQPLALVIGIE